MTFKTDSFRLYKEVGRGWFLTIPVPDQDVPALEQEICKDAPFGVTIAKYRERRSLNANAYFHILVNKIAEKTGTCEDQTKKKLVLRYGALARNEDGTTVGVMLPFNKEPEAVGIKYPKWFGDKTVLTKDGEARFSCYLVYAETHTYNREQMSRLINGAVDEARELGIETMTPAELAALVNRYERTAD